MAENITSNDLQLLNQLVVPIDITQEAARLKLLRETNLLDSDENDPMFDRFTSLAQRMFNCPFALVSLVDVDRQWFKSRVGIDASQTHRNDAFCTYTILQSSPTVFIVRDALTDDRFKNNVLVTGPPYIRFYAGAALMLENMRIGSFCIIDTKPHPDFSDEEELDLLDIGWMVSENIKNIRESYLHSRNQKLEFIQKFCTELNLPLRLLENKTQKLMTIWDDISKKEGYKPQMSPDGKEIDIKRSISELDFSVKHVHKLIELSSKLDSLLRKVKGIVKLLAAHDKAEGSVSKSGFTRDNPSEPDNFDDTNDLDANFTYAVEECYLEKLLEFALEVLHYLYGCSDVDWTMDKSLQELTENLVLLSYPTIVVFVVLATVNRFKVSTEQVSVHIGFQPGPNGRQSDGGPELAFIDGNIFIEIRMIPKAIISQKGTDADDSLDITMKAKLAERFERLQMYFTAFAHDISLEDLLDAIGGSAVMTSLNQCQDIWCATTQYASITNPGGSGTRGAADITGKGFEFFVPCTFSTMAEEGPMEGPRSLTGQKKPNRATVLKSSMGKTNQLNVLFICTTSKLNDASSFEMCRKWIELLHASNFNVRVVKGATEGLRTMKKKFYDVVFVDILMAARSATVLQLFNTWKLQHALTLRVDDEDDDELLPFNPEVLIIGLSSKASPVDVEHAYGHGMHFFLESMNDSNLLFWILNVREKFTKANEIQEYLEQQFKLLSKDNLTLTKATSSSLAAVEQNVSKNQNDDAQKEDAVKDQVVRPIEATNKQQQKADMIEEGIVVVKRTFLQSLRLNLSRKKVAPV